MIKATENLDTNFPTYVILSVVPSMCINMIVTHFLTEVVQLPVCQQEETFWICSPLDNQIDYGVKNSCQLYARIRHSQELDI